MKHRRTHSLLAFVLFLFISGFNPLETQAAPPDDPVSVLTNSNARLRRFVMDNGMICLVKEDHSAPVVSLQIWVKAGSTLEGEFMGGGLSHYLEHMIFKGTSNRAPGDITRAINDAGGDINAYTSQDRTVFHTTVPAREWTNAVDVLADAMMNASFPEEEWRREKEVILREFDMGEDDPGRVLNKLLYETAYTIHPYRYPVIGYKEVFSGMTREHLLEYYRRLYTPDNMIVALVGDIPAATAEDGLRKAFAACARRARAPQVLPVEPAQMGDRFARKTGPYEVARLAWTYPSVALSHPDTPALDVLASLVGSGRSSRLSESIKDRQQLAFDIGAWSFTPKDPGMFGISATYEPSQETKLLAAIEKEIDEWQQGRFTPEELDKARRMVLVGALSELQSMDGQASSYASGEFYSANPRFSEVYLAQVQAVTADQIADVARRYLTPGKRTLVILSPESCSTNLPAAEQAAGLNLQRLTLSNGVPLIVREDRRLPFVHICAALRGGLLSEKADDNGITQLMADLLTRGATNLTALDIARRVEGLGGSLTPFSGRNSFGLQASCLSQDVGTFMGLMADCLLQPSFDEGELAKRKTEQLAAIRQQREQPFHIADEALRQALFPDHPYRWTAEGSEGTVSTLTREQVVDYHRRHLSASNLVLSMFGDIGADEARALADKLFAGMPSTPFAMESLVEPNPRLPVRIKKREPRQQAVLLVGFPGVDVKDPRVDCLSLVANALSGMSSELFTEVREKRGLVYSIGGFQRTGIGAGLFTLYAATREDSIGEVERLMEEELRRIAQKGLTDDEFRRAKAQIVADHEMALQNNGGLAQSGALDELFGLGYRYSFDIGQRMDKITPQAVQKSAEAIFKTNRHVIVWVLPEATTQAEEQQHGKE